MTRRRKVTLLLLIPLCLYAAICAAVFFLQTALIFPVGQVPRAGPLPPGAERLSLDAATGERLVGLHIPPARQAGEGLPPVLVGFGGNAWNADDMAATLHRLYPVADVVAFHYRGYPPSQGSPAPPRCARIRSPSSTGRRGASRGGGSSRWDSASAAVSRPRSPRSARSPASSS